MEWSKAKSILIILLLAANIYLGTNIALQLRESRSSQKDMLHSAWTIITEQGAEVDEELLASVNCGREAYTFTRDVEAERRAAELLLGGCALESPGGGIYKYTSDTGEMTFRSGGYTELKYDGEDDGKLIQSLSAACEGGLEARETEGSYSLYMKGLPVVGSVISPIGGNRMSGSWIFGALSSFEGGAMDKASMILALGRALSERGLGEVRSIEEIYLMSPTQSGDVKLTPAWKVERDGGAFYLSTVSGEEIS